MYSKMESEESPSFPKIKQASVNAASQVNAGGFNSFQTLTIH